MQPPTIQALRARRGAPFSLVYPWTIPAVSTFWSASTTYAKNAIVQPFPKTGLFYRCTTAGTSGANPPDWPTFVGGTVTDGTVTWTAQSGTTYAPDLTQAGTSAKLVVRERPRSLGPALIELDVGTGLTLGADGTITIALTTTQLELLYAVGRYFAYTLDVTLPGPNVQPVLEGVLEVRPSTNRGESAIMPAPFSWVVQTPADASAMDVTGAASGSRVFVTGPGSPTMYLVLRKGSSATVDGVTVFAATGGRWERDLSWFDPEILATWVAAGTVHINGTSGSDLADGLTTGTSLRTRTEIIRRVGLRPDLIDTPVSLNVRDDVAATTTVLTIP